jgi:hypothetical protein
MHEFYQYFASLANMSSWGSTCVCKLPTILKTSGTFPNEAPIHDDNDKETIGYTISIGWTLNLNDQIMVWFGVGFR